MIYWLSWSRRTYALYWRENSFIYPEEEASICLASILSSAMGCLTSTPKQWSRQWSLELSNMAGKSLNLTEWSFLVAKIIKPNLGECLKKNPRSSKPIDIATISDLCMSVTSRIWPPNNGFLAGNINSLIFFFFWKYIDTQLSHQLAADFTPDQQPDTVAVKTRDPPASHAMAVKDDEATKRRRKTA